MAGRRVVQWSTGGVGAIALRVLAERPDLELTLGTAEDFSKQGMIATTMRVVNAIPYVCDAPPGLVSSADLPPPLPRHVFETARG
jgi:hypothetical protein